MKQIRMTYFLLLVSLIGNAAPAIPRQEVSPVANFSLNEDDTTRYTHHYLYEQAYQVISDMLTGVRDIDLKQAVFVVENCYFDGTLNHKEYIDEIRRISRGIQTASSIVINHGQNTNVALNYCIYCYLNQPAPLNGNRPYTYDTDAILGLGFLESGMVTRLVRTHKGTCHSLPLFYKILAEEVGAEAFIACAPMHWYIRHKGEDGRWWNYETTVGGFSRSSYIMESFYVSEAAIRSGMYMTNLSLKETIVLCLYDLLSIYKAKTGFYSNVFVRQCYSLGLTYHPISTLLICEINDIEYQMYKKLWKKGKWSRQALETDPELRAMNELLQKKCHALDSIGYHSFTEAEYLEHYKQSLEHLKQKEQK